MADDADIASSEHTGLRKKRGIRRATSRRHREAYGPI
jgi:hypothetical protein